MKVKVWNDNVHPYKETFRDREYNIPPGEFVEMEHDEAVLFKGSFSPILRDADGQPDPKGFKKIRLEFPTQAETTETKVNPLLCQSCRYLALSPKDLEAHLTKHADQVVVDEEAEAEMKRRGPGRPKKPEVA